MWFYRDSLAITILLSLIVLLFHDVPSGYWRYDDTAILWHALNSKGLSAFYDPANWQALSSANLTPWVTFSFKVDLLLAGLSPRFFYIHHLSSLGLVAMLAYILCRQWTTPLWACLCVCLFLVGEPVAVVANQLMTRHYLEGMLFALLAMLAFILALRQQRMAWSIAGALAYALATTAKEVYVPMVLLPFFIPSFDGFSARLRMAAPYFCVAIFYVIWRQYMLGTTLGGYAETSAIANYPINNILSTTSRLPGFFFGPDWRWPTLLTIAVVVTMLIKNLSLIPIACALLTVVFVPLIPLFPTGLLVTADRLLFAFWLVVSMASVLTIYSFSILFANKKILQGIIGGTICLILVAFALKQSIASQSGLVNANHEYDVTGRFIFHADAKDAFVPTPSIVGSYWYVAYLCKIKQHLEMTCPNSLIRGLPVNKNFEHLYVYDHKTNAMEDITGQREKEIARLEWVDMERPLLAWLESKGALRWHFGPYDSGDYYLASPELGRYHFNKSGTIKIAFEEISFYVQYESPEGWITSSPLMHLKKGQSLDWRRTAKETPQNLPQGLADVSAEPHTQDVAKNN